ncbi:hypothetical protein CDD80_4865 [Ophiocordyceps camponoti-rufipedis]|uniref:THUMP domain-containing protein n=1 Tax=Ophiocordyceps camponoti-rufipedis TaxID=2004952 RepID=A0A2C5ZI55_9HYPO|nr:hypothetical protein CDD80_4865 [Ophiocordyceps camponoti-rufipedis]
MEDGAQKRKQRPGCARGGESTGKRSKVKFQRPRHASDRIAEGSSLQGGSAGRWKTPHQQAKTAEKTDTGAVLDVGDGGIWVTFVRGMQTKALREFKALCGEYCETMYNMTQLGSEDTPLDDETSDERDIESSIQDELSSLKEKSKLKPREPFRVVTTGLDCLFFMKLSKPIDPASMVSRMCEDARDCPEPRLRKCRYINRLTPVTDIDRATEKGIVRVGRKVLAPFFALQGDAEAQVPENDSALPCTYAIRYNIRNHTAFTSDAVIKLIASLIHSRHKVKLGKPDKVILVEIFQLFCGLSVVDGREWEALKRYNVNSLYEMPRPETGTEAAPSGS